MTKILEQALLEAEQLPEVEQKIIADLVRQKRERGEVLEFDPGDA